MPHTLRLTNTASGQKELFAPLAAPRVGFYSCGPTVYNHAHIGNLATYIFNDLLKRVLRRFGYDVTHVMNITDVDDKMIRRAKELGITMQALGDEYTEKFLADCALLAIEPPTTLCRATEHLDAMLALTKRLVDAGVAYERDGSVYFSIAKFPAYAAFAHLDAEALKSSEAPLSAADEAYEKDDVRDFALWKAWTPDDGDVVWDSPWGKGRPGWHIECSAMSMQYLGESFDLHTGAIDLIFPHHTNEIAQSEAATGKPFVKTWLHRGFVQMGGEKMAKRVGNVLRLADITTSDDPHVRQLEALAYRLLVLSSHYRSALNYTDEIFAQFKTNLLTLLTLAADLATVPGKHSHAHPGVQPLIASTQERFDSALEDDLNTPVAFAALFEFVRTVNGWLAARALDASDAQQLHTFLLELDSILGIFERGLPSFEAASAPTSAQQQQQLEELARLRAAKDYAAADALRAALLASGLQIQQTTAGVTARRAVFPRFMTTEERDAQVPDA